MKPTIANFLKNNPLRILLILVLSTASVATVVAQGLGPAGPSPATGHASVVATGSIEISEQSARWHITRHTTEEAGSDFSSPTQGFIVAENTPILVVVGEHSTRLAGGEAMSVPGGSAFNVTTFGAPDTFIFIQVLGESGDQLSSPTNRILTSASFSVEPAQLDASLIRDVLSEGEEGSIPEGTTPTSIYVHVGEIEVSSSRGTTNLFQGDAATFNGEVTITAIADGSVYYAGFIGAPLPVAATPASATPEPTEIPATPEPTAVPTEVAIEIPATPEPVEEVVETPATPEAPATPVVPEAPEVPEEGAREIRTDIPEYLETVENPATLDPAAFDLDSDGDFVSDGVEIALGMDQNNPDSDGDGLDDYDEIHVHMTNPLNPDTDDDGINDGDEVHTYGTDPNNTDTDGDLFYDGGEVIRGTDPLNTDTDADGLLDGQEEYVHLTDPLNPDTDGDGVSDGDEINNGTDPLDPTSF